MSEPMGPSARLCPYCYAGTPREASVCWMCNSALPPFEQRAAPDTFVAPPPPAGERLDAEKPRGAAKDPDFVLWAMGAIVTVGLMGVITVETAYFFGGFAVLVVAVCIPILVVLGRMLWVRRPRDPKTTGDEVNRVLGAVAMTIVGVAAVLALAMLVVVAIVVLLVIACFVVLAANGGLSGL